MNEQQAQRAVEEAMATVDPNWAGGNGTGDMAWTAFRLMPRGDRYDVILRQAGTLYAEYSNAIRLALGANMGTVSGD